jgi:hypothetical protein
VVKHAEKTFRPQMNADNTLVFILSFSAIMGGLFSILLQAVASFHEGQRGREEGDCEQHEKDV